jgi:hypothetical protein
MNKQLIATPISHLFENELNAKDIIAVSDCLEVRQRSLESSWPNQKLFHIDIDLSHPWDHKIKDYLSNAFSLKTSLEVVTFQSTRCCEGEKLINGMFQSEGRVFSKNDMITFAKENTIWLRENLNSNILIGLENNNYYPTEAYKSITDGEFLSTLVHDNDLFLLLDIAHAMVTAHNKSIEFKSYLSTLPLDKMLQVHICQPELPNGEIGYDAHNEPNVEMENLVLDLIKKFPKIKYLTIEYYKDKDILIKSIDSLKNRLFS